MSKESNADALDIYNSIMATGGDPKKDTASFMLDRVDSAPKPIMSPEVEGAVLTALAQYKYKDKWKQWGMDSISEQGSSILLWGPPGTGKTVIARWMAKSIGRGFKQLSVASLMSDGSPGSTEREVTKFFTDCRKRNGATIFMDECDQLLMSRDGDLEASWQIATIETLMMEISKYKGLFIAATNHPQNLDGALDQRFMSIIHVDRPDSMLRLKLWKTKMPKKFPLRLSEADFRQLSAIDLNGRQIECAIMNCAREAMRLRERPKLSVLRRFALIESQKHIERNAV